MSYYNNQEAKVNVMNGLIERGWKVYGYRADQSDMMTDYWCPAHWDGIAEKDGFVLLVDMYGTGESGKEITKKGYTADYSKIKKLEALRDDKASTENEKASCNAQIERMKRKEKESTIVIEKYPTFKFANPKRCSWHLEKDGEIIAKGTGVYSCYDGNDHIPERKAEVIAKVNKLIDRIEKNIVTGEQLEKKVVKEVKKVIKPIETSISIAEFVKDQTIIKLNSSFTGGHYKGELLQFISSYTYNNKRQGKEVTTLTFVRLGKKYQQLKANEKNMIVLNSDKLVNWLENGTITTVELKEVEEVTEKTVYVKTKRKEQPEQQPQDNNLITSEQATQTAQAETQPQQPKEDNSITVLTPTFETGTGKKGNGIEITFAEKPNKETRDIMKSHGFRWGGKNRASIWWAILTDETLKLAEQICNVNNGNNSSEQNEPDQKQPVYSSEQVELTSEQIADTFTELINKYSMTYVQLNDDQKEEVSNGLLAYITDNNIIINNQIMDYMTANYSVLGGVLSSLSTLNNNNSDSEKSQNQTEFTYPDIDIDDISTYTINKDLQRREHDSNFIFRRNEADRTKEIQDIFTNVQNKVLELINMTENERIIYYLKRDLQRFKKKYYDIYVKMLRHRSENPSWAVTGRGGLNVSRYNKQVNRYDKMMGESVEISNTFEKALNRAKNEIRKDKEQKIKNAINEQLKNTDNNITFKTERKQFTYMNMKENKRVYVYNEYWICKLWACFRIFKNGKEVHSMKTTEKLEDAKNYVAYLVQQEQEEKKVI